MPVSSTNKTTERTAAHAWQPTRANTTGVPAFARIAQLC
jgi:hypothetical protein